jgi:hypothetical protein
MPSVPRQGRKLHDEVRRRRFILSPDLCDDPTFYLRSDNWLTFRAWEFDPRSQAGYLSNMGFFNNELGVGLTKEEEDEDKGHDD